MTEHSSVINDQFKLFVFAYFQRLTRITFIKYFVYRADSDTEDVFVIICNIYSLTVVDSNNLIEL